MADSQGQELNNQFYNSILDRIRTAGFELSFDIVLELDDLVRSSVIRLGTDYIPERQLLQAQNAFTELADLLVADTRRKRLREVGSSSLRVVLNKFCPRFPIC